jgi:WD40 repeat protein
MSIATAQPKYCFGVKGDVSNNVWYLDEQSIIYPSGANLVIFNVDQKMQKFISGSPGSEGMTALAVSPNKRYAAIAEMKPEKPIITVYDLASLRKRKILAGPETASTEIISLAFSPDSKYLISQLSSPDWLLTYWHWEKGKAMATVKSNGATNYPVKQVSRTGNA